MPNSEQTGAANHIPESSEQASCRETGNPPAWVPVLGTWVSGEHSAGAGLMVGVRDLFQLGAFPSLTIL